jgi:O-antigen/teichoic acid export membrane protein
MARGAAVSRSDVARGAGLAGLSRLGAAIEALAQPVYIWLFGLAVYGLYVVLWATINFVSNFIDLSLRTALQRAVPTAATEDQAHAAVKFALLAGLSASALLALLVMLSADWLAAFVSAPPEERAQLPTAIRIFAWALPLWTFVEIATSAARARRAFGPEIRLRVFWEQTARLLFALLFFSFAFGSLGLVAAHTASLALTAALCVPLLARYYDLRLLLRAPVSLAMARDLTGAGITLLPSNLSRRFLIDGPPVALNLMLPGAQGAIAAGLFEIGRKISTVPLIVRQAFQYVMAPLSSAQANADRSGIAPLYRFAARVSTAMVVPLAGLLIFAGRDILSVYREEAAAALPILIILVAARAVEAVVGPATPIVEMIGRRSLPLFNSLIGLAIWALLAFWLVPLWGALGMAVAVGAATVAIAWAAMLQLRASDGISPFGGALYRALLIALVGVGLMALAENFLGGPARFAAVLFFWFGTTWLTLRFGLSRQDREALGGLGHRLRLWT